MKLAYGVCRIFPAVLGLILSSLLTAAVLADDEDTGPVYELRTYVCNEGKVDALHSRFRDHTTKLFEKHGIKNIAYWTVVDGKLPQQALVYIIEHKNREAADASWKAFREDPEWLKVKEESEAAGAILAKAPESVYMKPTEYSPEIRLPNADNIYEMRIYYTNEGKLPDLHKRFKDHTIGLFDKHGLRNFAYFTPVDEPKASNTLIYFLEYDDRDAAREAWSSFMQDGSWREAFRASEANGRLMSGFDNAYLEPTDFSPSAEKSE